MLSPRRGGGLAHHRVLSAQQAQQDSKSSSVNDHEPRKAETCTQASVPAEPGTTGGRPRRLGGVCTQLDFSAPVSSGPQMPERPCVPRVGLSRTGENGMEVVLQVEKAAQ